MDLFILFLSTSPFFSSLMCISLGLHPLNIILVGSVPLSQLDDSEASK